ncbi:GNAT family N-acetyltransferase [Maritalea sp.]|uniref:GNAT family N-acetyltransferase n=1 Tax=Maritalea sp. TaxID=2003361 RepID=UPI003EF9904B
MNKWIEPIELEGEHVKAVPLSHEHTQDLEEAAADGELHRLWYTAVPKPQDISTKIDQHLSLQESGSMVPFAIIDKASGKAVGMTTYMNVDNINKRLEIGSTWYAKSVQRSPLNTECKILLLTHAFETLDAIAVEFRTHFMNQQSRRAIERLGAKLDGVLRRHIVLPNGTVRDTAVYSIIPSEWPSVKANLQWKLDMPRD